MKEKRAFKEMNRLSLLFFLLIIIVAAVGTMVSVSAYEKISTGDFELRAYNQGKDNFIYLEWDDTGADRFYSIYQSVDSGGSWTQQSGMYGKKINVLNVYPTAGADGLEEWMNDYGKDPDTEEPLIYVDKVLISAFNAAPDSWLKDDSGDYVYDVVAFGFYDSNGHQDLSSAALSAVGTYIENGYGVLIGHDTAAINTSGGGQLNFAELAREYFNIEVLLITDVPKVSGKWIRSINDGFLLRYPWEIPYGESLEVPESHTYAQIANGTIWMEYVDYSGMPVTRPGGGSSNFYLTTWQNTAMIQTGHTNGKSYESEQKILANVLTYLAQYTDETFAYERTASDREPPKAATATWSTDVKELTISAEDRGTPYWYKVESTSKHDITDLKISDEVLEYCTSGIEGYYVKEDRGSYLDFDETTAVYYPAAADGTLAYTMTNQKNNIHVKAVDYAGNVGDPALLSLYDGDWDIMITKTIDEISKFDQSFLFLIEYRSEAIGTIMNEYYGVVTISAGDLSGTIEFQNILPGAYTVTEVESNWNYELDSWALASQPVLLFDQDDPTGTADYLNNFQETAWISGAAKLENNLKQLH